MGSRRASPARGSGRRAGVDGPATTSSGAGSPSSMTPAAGFGAAVATDIPLRRRVSSLRSERSASGSESPHPATGGGEPGASIRSPTSSLFLFDSQSDQDSTYSNSCLSPSSPSAWASAFPTSSRLVSRLNEMGDLLPPEPEAGMGMTVEPTFGLDGRMDAASMRLAEAAAAADRGRRLARKNSGEFYHRPKAIRRMTEEEQEQEDESESEFQRELRKAREELEVKAQEQFRTQQVEERDRWKLKAARESGSPRTAPQAASKSAAFFSTPITTTGPQRAVETVTTTTSSDSSATASPARSDGRASRPGSSDSSASDGSLGFASTAGLTMRKVLHSPLPERDPSPLASPPTAVSSLERDDDATLLPSTTQTSRSRVGNSIFHTTTAVPAPFARTSALTDSRKDNAPASQQRELKAPSPILAPFARSSPLSSLTV